MRAVVVGLVAGVFACGNDGGGDGGTATSGTRLKLTWYAIDDGPRTYSREPGYFDALLAQPCKPRLWTDGITRCTLGLELGELRYADPGCSQPITIEPGLYAVTVDRTCRETRVDALYRVGAPVSLMYGAWSIRADGTCVADGVARDAWQLEARPPVDFVTLDSTEFSNGDPTFRVRIESSEDGMSRPVALRDRAIAADCKLAAAVNATTTTCAPVTTFDVAEAFYWEDVTCSGAPLFAVADGCPVPPIALDSSAVADSYRQVIASTVIPTYTTQFNSCRPSGSFEDTSFHSVGAPIEIATLPRAPDPAAGRIAELYVTAGSLRFRAGLYDALFDTDCTIRPLPDGALRCLPTTYNLVFDYFSDAQCTSPALLAIADVKPGASAPENPYAIHSTPTEDPAVTALAVHTIGAAYSGATYGMNQSGECFPINTSTLYTVGPPIPLTDFALATPSYE